MTKTEQLDQLYSIWEKEIPEYNGCFVKDGIINEEEWNKTTPKILFICKEANQYGVPKAGCFREDWRSGNHDYLFSYRIAEWAFGIIEGFKRFYDIFNDWPRYHDYLQRIAFINIKKSGGTSSSNKHDLIKHLDQEKQVAYLQKQIQIINPEIIVLCFSFSNQLRERIFPGINDEVDQCGYCIEVAKMNEVKIIDFYHPSSRNAPAASYSLLQNVWNSPAFQNL